MEIESARILKRELVASLREVGTQAAASSSGSVGVGGVGLGLTPGRRRGQVHLALRVSDPGWREHPVVLDLERRAVGEVDVQVVGTVRAPRPVAAAADPTARTRPMVPGVSVAHVDVTAGTLGCFVTLEGHQGPALLSNNHVIAASDAARVGDAVLQPGPADGGQDPGDRVATLTVALPLTGQHDVAAALLDDASLAGGNTVPGGELAGLVGPGTGDGGTDDDSDAVAAGEVTVAKTGRTTGHTTGLVTAVEVDGLTIDYDGRAVTFDDLIEVDGSGPGPFSQGGDSGSVIYTEDGLLGYALLFAGSTTGGASGQGLTYATALPAALASIGATLL